MRLIGSRSARRFAAAAAVAALAAMTAGCQTTQGTPTAAALPITAATDRSDTDWHILSAQGAVLDQMGRHAEAQRYYVTALKIVPEEPAVLSNLGLSYALAKDLPNAETTLRRAAAHRPANPRVRQNLALVVGLQ